MMFDASVASSLFTSLPPFHLLPHSILLTVLYNFIQIKSILRRKQCP